MNFKHRLAPAKTLLFCGILALTLISSRYRGAVLAAGPTAEIVHKVILEKDSPAADLPGVSLWHDYGSFGLYRVTGQEYANYKTLGSIQGLASSEIDQIWIDAYPFNPLVDRLVLPRSLSLEEPAGSALQLVQFVGPIKGEWLDALESTGITPVHYIPNHAYLVWADGKARGQLATMVKTGDFLQYSAPYQPFFKLGGSLLDRVIKLENPGEIMKVLIQMYRHPEREASESIIKGLSRSQQTPWHPVLAFQNTVVELQAADIPLVANLPDVFWIGEQFKRELFDEVQGQILAGAFAPGQAGPAGPGYLAWLASLGFSQDPADYPVVDITDDGIGNGTVNSGDPTLHVNGSLGKPTRLAYIQNCTSSLDGGGVGGHGHLNASIMGGYDARAGSAYNDLEGFNLGLGLNPFGQLAGTRIFDPDFDLSRCGNSDPGVIQASYLGGARISSNSWGCGDCAGSYDDSSQAYDVGTRDAVLSQPGNQQLAFIFAAGNSGPGSATIGTPGNAKNVITVGASENDRPTWTDGCAVGPTRADNAMDVESFSSRGPAPGGRAKPEVIAPGTHIQGAASTSPAYTGATVCDRYHPNGQTLFSASSGTSHSTPAVAGVASLYYYWLQNNYGLAVPSPAMLKAYLIAHPTYLTGLYANDALPSYDQGYGMPDMSLAFDETARYLVDQTVIFNNSGETWIFEGGIQDPGKPVRVALAYTDQAGAIGASPQVNNLDLSVEVDGERYLGNRFSGQWSASGGLPDDKNNYEAVFLPAGPGGSLKITVTAFNIAGDGVPNTGDSTDQDFALVCYNCAESADFTLSVSPASQAACTQAPGEASFTVSVGSILGYSAAVTLNASGLPAGASLNFGVNPVIPPGTSPLTISGLGGDLAGSYPIEITGISPDSEKTTGAALELYDSTPGRPVLLGPVDGASDVLTRPTFAWSASSGAASYSIEIALDGSFTTIVDTSGELLGTSYVPTGDLEAGSLYYWRVRAENACGEGQYSSAAVFSTLPPPGECPLGQTPTTVFNENFDSGGTGWSHTGTEDTWSISQTRAYSGNSAYLGIALGRLGDQWLISPEITLPEDQEPLFLHFWNYQEIESSSAGTVCYDGAVLEISTDGGQNWAQVLVDDLLTDPYDAIVSSSFENPIEGQPAWCGDPQDWLNSIIALNDYAGQKVRLRFRLATDQSVGREGWYIDDVLVQGCQDATTVAAWWRFFLPLSAQDFEATE